MTADLARLADLIGSDGWIAAMGILFFFGVGELVHRAVAGHHRVPHYKLRATNLLHQQGDVPGVALGSTAPSGEPQPAPTVPTDPGAGPNLQSGLSRLEQGRRRDHSSEQPQPASGTTHSGAGPTPPVSPAVAGDSQAPVALATSPSADREGIPAGSTAHRELPAGPTNVPTPGHSPGVLHSEAGTVRDADTPPQPSSTVSASPTKRPAAVCPPERAAAGLPRSVA
jgi:hypothetical protein